ncbi:hypothetical protein HYV82_00110 [Candidatus Woesearchaeota archaeon]|nr:hypothetical protein [Candidatus Woesearchaeota archaeon]
MVFDSGLVGLVERASDAAEQVQSNIRDAAELIIGLASNPPYVRFGRSVLGAENNEPISLYSLTSDACGPGYVGIRMTGSGIRVLPGSAEQIVECEWGADPQTIDREKLYQALGALSAKKPLPAKDTLDAEFAAYIKAYIEINYRIHVNMPDTAIRVIHDDIRLG